MLNLQSWKWGKKIIPEEIRKDHRNISSTHEIYCINIQDFSKWRKHDVVLVTGDGLSLIEDVKAFESWGIPHDLFCCNRSLLYFQRPVNHWAAVDSEECTWLSQYYNPDNGHFLRHSIGGCLGFDAYWQAKGVQTEFGKRLWIGNTGYFAILCALAMGYQKIVASGMPLDRSRHWYDPENAQGPTWLGDVYTIWMDFKMKSPHADKVRSMSGYSAFILGDATREWFNIQNQ